MKAPLHKPLIVFRRGWWRVERQPGPWKNLRWADQTRITQTHNHVNFLNLTPEAVLMRGAYYDRLRAERRGAFKTIAVNVAPGVDNYEITSLPPAI
ncbi:hypothetical protein D3C87_1018420 [compost metagenome]